MNLWLSFGLTGAVLLAVALVLFGQARPARLPATFLTVMGLPLLMVPVFPGLQQAFLPNKIRVFMGGVSLLLLFVTLEALRRNRLKERYALLWIGTGLVLLVFAIQPDVIGWLVTVTGMHYTSAIMLVVFGFLIMIAFHVSLVLSKQEDNRRRLTQELALLRERVSRLESERDLRETVPASPPDAESAR